MGCVFDNAAVNQGTEKILEEKFPTVFAQGCMSHGLNLLMKDLCALEEYRKLLELCISLVKSATNHQFVCAKVQELRKEFKVARKLSMPNETRFATKYRMAERVWENKTVLRALLEEHVDVIDDTRCRDSKEKEKFKTTIEDIGFWANLKTFITALKPVDTALTESEGAACYIEFIYPTFMNLLVHFKDINLGATMKNEQMIETYRSYGSHSFATVFQVP